MARSVKDFVDITDHRSLDDLIDRLIAVRDTLPAEAAAEVRMRGDDVFGRKLSVLYRRPQTEEEAECEARYAEAHRATRQIAQNRASGRRLRVVA
jgi:hypothetical protein